MAELLLSVDDLTVSFGEANSPTTIVKGVSFAMEKGETIALVGESGSGKSVSTLAIIGLIGKGNRKKAEHIGGRIAFAFRDGVMRDIAGLEEADMRKIQGSEIAMIFQEPMTALNPVLTIGEQLSEPLIEHRGLTRKQARAKAEELLTRVGIPDAPRWLKQYPHQMSGGMRQRVMIAMALSCEPSLLIADEPTTALDVTIQAQILDLIQELKQDIGTAILFISHDLAVVSQIADRIIVMYSGYVVEQGHVADIIEKPLHPYTQGLISCIPHVELDRGMRRSLTPIPGVVADPSNPPAGCPFHPRCAHAVRGLCDQQVPQLEAPDRSRAVRCLRWQEIRALVQ